MDAVEGMRESDPGEPTLPPAEDLVVPLAESPPTNTLKQVNLSSTEELP